MLKRQVVIEVGFENRLIERESDKYPKEKEDDKDG